MKKLDLRHLIGTFVFASTVAFFGAPSSPIVGSVPTVGGKALAYAPPCSYEWWVYQYVWAEYQEYGGQHYYDFVVLPAKDAYYDCLYG